MERVKKAKTKQRISLSAVVLAAALMVSGFASCSKSETELPSDGSRAISLSANVQATTQTKAAVAGTTFPANTDDVFRLTTFSGTAAPTTNWSTTPYFNNIQVNSGNASALTLATKQYYPANGNRVYFYGYTPSTTLTVGTSTTAPVATYTITGQEDIMAAQATTGISAATSGTQPQPTLAFTHKLMQVRFKIVKDASFEAGKKVTEILVKNVKTSAKLNIGTGVLTFDGTATQTLSLPIIAGTKDDITTAGIEMDGCIMLEPTGAAGTITLDVTAGGILYDGIKVTLSGTNNGKAGTSHLVTLTFKRESITPSATITPWIAPVDKDVNVDGEELADFSTIGELRGGGIVYEVNGASAKVFSLDQTNLMWSAKNTYVLDEKAQSTTDGKANVAAMKAYSLANTGNSNANKKTTGVFATDFPAAEFCDKKNTGGVTGWYLPAKDELKALYTAYTIAANKTAIDAGLANNSGTAIQASGEFWSSTEYIYGTGGAWCVYFSSGGTGGNGKSGTSYVRCVRDI